MSEKVCFKCGILKPLSEFYGHPAMADGHLNKCKSCTKTDSNKHRADNLESVKAYDRQRGMLPHRVVARAEYAQTEAGKHAGARAKRKYINNHPDRRKANIIVGNAVRDGRLIPLPCFVCGETAEAHHPDYSRPLDVVWLCPKHHKAAHALADD